MCANHDLPGVSSPSRRGFLFKLGLALNVLGAALVGIPILGYILAPARRLGGGAAWISKGQIAVQQTLPLALEVVSVEPEVLPGDTPENTYRPQQGGDQQQSKGPGRHMIGPRI